MAALKGKRGVFGLSFSKSVHAGKAVAHIAELLQTAHTRQTLTLSHRVLFLFIKHLFGQVWHWP